MSLGSGITPWCSHCPSGDVWPMTHYPRCIGSIMSLWVRVDERRNDPFTLDAMKSWENYQKWKDEEMQAWEPQ